MADGGNNANGWFAVLLEAIKLIGGLVGSYFSWYLMRRDRRENPQRRKHERNPPTDRRKHRND